MWARFLESPNRIMKVENDWPSLPVGCQLCLQVVKKTIVKVTRFCLCFNFCRVVQHFRHLLLSSGVLWTERLLISAKQEFSLAVACITSALASNCIGQFPWKQRETSIPFPSNWYLLWKWECYFFTAEKIDSSSNI